MGPRRGRWLLLAFLAILVAWLVPATFVALYEPPTSRDATSGSWDPFGERPRFFLFAHGYAKAWTVDTWEGDSATATHLVTHWQVERGPLDRATGTFELGVRRSEDDGTPPHGMRLFVTSASDWASGSDDQWTLVEETGASVPPEGSLVCAARVPAATTAYRVRELWADGGSGGFSQTIPTAPTFWGRLYDDVAWWPTFRWVPRLR